MSGRGLIELAEQLEAQATVRISRVLGNSYESEAGTETSLARLAVGSDFARGEDTRRAREEVELAWLLRDAQKRIDAEDAASDAEKFDEIRLMLQPIVDGCDIELTPREVAIDVMAIVEGES